MSGSGVVSGSAPSGRLPGVFLAGQPPSIEWMTIHLELFVAGLSVVREIWQEPPPWTAVPLNERVCCWPMAMLVTGAPALLVALQGKLAPAGSRGDLSGLPYEGGFDMIMWALLEVEKSAMAEAARRVLSDIFRLRSVCDSSFLTKCAIGYLDCSCPRSTEV